MKIIYRYCLLGLFVFFLLFLGCQKNEEKLIQLRIGHAPHDHHAPLYIAASNPDFFKKNGGVYLKEIIYRKKYELIANDFPIALVDIDSSTGGKELIRKLDENHFDLAFGGVPAIINFIDKGSSIGIIAPSNAEGAGLVVSQDLPVDDWQGFAEFVRASERPVRIGYKVAVSVQNLIFEKALQETGLSFSREVENRDADITLVNLYGAKNLIPSLNNTLIEGFVVNQPWPALAEYQQSGKLISSLYTLPPEGKWKGSPCCALAGRKEYIISNPEVAEAITTLILRSNLFIRNNTKLAADQIANWLDTPVEVELKSLPTSLFTPYFTDSWHRGVDFWIQTMVDNGKLKGNVKKVQKSGELHDLIYIQDLYDKAHKNLL